MSFAVLIVLLAGGGGQSEHDFAVVGENIAPASPQSSRIKENRLPPNPACAPDREGRFTSFGNRWGRYGDLCIDQVQVSFEAYPDPTLSYTITSDRCHQVEQSSTFHRPADFFERSVPEQIDLLRIAFANDLGAFARQCRIKLDPTPFVDDRFDRFYATYGDGWWFDRLDDGFRLTPNVASE